MKSVIAIDNVIKEEQDSDKIKGNSWDIQKKIEIDRIKARYNKNYKNMWIGED